VVAATRPLGPHAVGSLPYDGPGTASVAATFVDPRTGGVVEHVVVGDTFEHEFAPAAVAVSPDRRWVAVTSGLATTVLDARTRDEVERIVLPPTGYQNPDGTKPTVGVVCCATWTHDGSRLLIGTQGLGNTGGISVVDPATWEVVEEGVELPVKPEAIELGADGRWLAVASGDSDEVVILDGGTLDVRQTVPLRAGDRLTTLSFSPDGRLLAAGGEFGTLHLFDTRTWTAREPVRLGEGPMLQIEWLDDDATVVATDGDGTVALFDTERAVVRSTPLPGAVDGGPAATYVIPEPSREILAISERPTVLRYPTDPAVWLREACAVVGRDLTRAEWERYLPGRPWAPTCSELG
jgi:WD40 repeat protein